MLIWGEMFDPDAKPLPYLRRMTRLDRSKMIRFLETDIWMIQANELNRIKSFGLRQLRLMILAIKGFQKDLVQLRASALTFYTLLSIVPVLAMAFGIAKGFGFEKLLEKQLMARLPGQEEVVTQIITFAHSMLESTKGGLVAGIGLALLFWAVIRVLGNIESSFNNIWGIKGTRSLGRKFSDYLSIMLISPILLIMSGSLTVFVTTQVRNMTHAVSLLDLFSPLISFLLRFLPYAAIWGLFTFVYILLPNTRVRFLSGLVAGVVAGTLYQIVQGAYITFQVGVARYNAIYGSFAALPLFLIWLHISWLIVLFGAEISFAHQNVDTYELEPESLRISNRFKRLLSLLVCHVIIKDFSNGSPPRTAVDLSQSLAIPIRLCRQVLSELVSGHILSEVKTDQEKESAYQPARDISNLSVGSVVAALDNQGIENLPTTEIPGLEALSETLDRLDEAVQESPANRLLVDIEANSSL